MSAWRTLVLSLLVLSLGFHLWADLVTRTVATERIGLQWVRIVMVSVVGLLGVVASVVDLQLSATPKVRKSR